jgi:hypothetical protein
VITEPEDPSDRGRLRWLLAIAGLLAVLVLGMRWPGCREYPAVTSREAMTQMKLLYSACNTQDPERLTRVEQTLAKLRHDGKLSLPEQDAFARIIDKAKQGRWAEAEAAALRFAQDQIGQGRP